MNWLVIALIILAALFFGLGFVVKGLFWIALVLFLVWVISLLVRRIQGR